MRNPITVYHQYVEFKHIAQVALLREIARRKRVARIRALVNLVPVVIVWNVSIAIVLFALINLGVI